MNVPETRFAKTADGVPIAHQVVGDGPVELVRVVGWTSNLEARWEDPGLAGFSTGLAFGLSEGGPLATLSAATYPERSIGSVLFGTDPDHTSMQPDDAVIEDDDSLGSIDEHRGTAEHARREIATWGAPSRAGEHELKGVPDTWHLDRVVD
jgi:hypothetical protein